MSGRRQKVSAICFYGCLQRVSEVTVVFLRMGSCGPATKYIAPCRPFFPFGPTQSSANPPPPFAAGLSEGSTGKLTSDLESGKRKQFVLDVMVAGEAGISGGEGSRISLFARRSRGRGELMHGRKYSVHTNMRKMTTLQKH